MISSWYAYCCQNVKRVWLAKHWHRSDTASKTMLDYGDDCELRPDCELYIFSIYALFFSWSASLSCAFWQTSSTLSCAFLWWMASAWPLYQKAWLMECCSNGCPSVSFSHFPKGNFDLIYSDHSVNLVWPRPFFLSYSVWLLIRSSKSLGAFKLLTFKNNAPCCSL